MPIETIKCRECGSAEVTEFKPGSYVCGHCEAVFKHRPSPGTAAGCEIDDCGVSAIGRCEVCNRAFCSTHVAYIEGSEISGGWPPSFRWVRRAHTGLCRACHAEHRARSEKMRAATTKRIGEIEGILRESNNLSEITEVARDPMFDKVAVEAVCGAWRRLTSAGAIEPTDDVVTVERRRQVFNHRGLCREMSRDGCWRTQQEGVWLDAGGGALKSKGRHGRECWPSVEVAVELAPIRAKQRGRRPFEETVIVPHGNPVAPRWRSKTLEIPGAVWVGPTNPNTLREKMVDEVLVREIQVLLQTAGGAV